MPSKFVTRNLKSNTYYHVYNIGPGGMGIFLDREDYETFLYYLHIYTADPNKVKAKYPNIPERLLARSLFNDVFVISYCIMPNHFHLLLKQTSGNGMPKLLKQITNAYITYSNTKYKRKGTVFNGRYKSVAIESEYLLAQMMRFVHLNAPDFKNYEWSSYASFGVPNRFGNREEWENFHLDTKSYEENLLKIKHLVID